MGVKEVKEGWWGMLEVGDSYADCDIVEDTPEFSDVVEELRAE